MKNSRLILMALSITFFNSCEKLRYELVPTRIEGRVIDIITGEPIPNADITLWTSEEYRYREVAYYQADAEGNFKIKHKFNYYKDDPPKDRYHISAKKEGYLKFVRKVHETEIQVNNEAIAEIQATRANKNIVLKLIPVSSLELDVEDVYPYNNSSNRMIKLESVHKTSNTSSYLGGGCVWESISNQYNLFNCFIDSIQINEYDVKIILYDNVLNQIGEVDLQRITVKSNVKNYYKIQY